MEQHPLHLPRSSARRSGSSNRRRRRHLRAVHHAGAAKNIHIVLAMSPIGDEFRVRCACSPPGQLLHHRLVLGVAGRRRCSLSRTIALTSEDDAARRPPEAKGSSDFCSSTRACRRRAPTTSWPSCGRYNYVTPTSYLELLNVLQEDAQEEATRSGEDAVRLQNGLDKLCPRRRRRSASCMQKLTAELKPSSREDAARRWRR